MTTGSGAVKNGVGSNPLVVGLGGKKRRNGTSGRWEDERRDDGRNI